MLEIYTLLNPMVPSYGLGTGAPSVTAQDVAACLGSIKIAGPALLVRTMAGDVSCHLPLLQTFRQHVAHLAMVKRWKTGPSFSAHFDGLCESVVHFYVLPDTCRRCRGRETIVRQDGHATVCPVCMGAGHREVNESDKARAASIPWATWCDTWADRYVTARTVLEEWEDMADRATLRLWWRDA